jgi:acyl-coenzyme A synthetase/AMP-(fatty) acid ligase
VKKLRIGRRRGKHDSHSLSPLELALLPALEDGRWQVPDRFNFTRDVVETLAEDPRRRALTSIGADGIIEPRTFRALSEQAARWSSLLRERDVRPGDPVLVLTGTNVDWLEIVLACLKVGAVAVPGAPTVPAETLDVRLERTGANLVVAERAAESELERTTNRPLVLYVDDAQALLEDAPEQAGTHDTSARDIAFVVETPGTGGNAKLVGHSYAAVFAARVAAEHWLDAGRGDAVWCPAEPGSSESIWHSLVGPWSRGAELLLYDGAFDPLERLDLIYRLGVTVLCQTPAEYAALSELRELSRSRPPQLRRLVSTGEWLDPEVAAKLEEAWGLTIHDGYGQAETNVVIASGAGAGLEPGSLGTPLPGHQVAVIDDHGNELPPGAEGELAVRGRPPTLFAGYWESPEQTKAAFRGDWYVTGDMATVDEDGSFRFVGRASDVIQGRGERFGPYDVERALRAHEAVAASAVVGIHDLERGGQFVRAFVVLAPGARASEHLEAELRVELGERLPEHEVPREIEFVDELPTSPGGKVRRLELRERHVVGRPLWDLSTTTEPERDPWAGMLDPSPAAEAELVVEPDAVEEQPSLTEVLRDYVVEPGPDPEPESALEPADPSHEAAAELLLEPVVEEEQEPGAVPTTDILPGPEPEPSPPEPLREPEPIPEPGPELPREPEPDPPTPPELVPEPEPEQEQEALVELEPEVEVEVEPELPKDVWVPVVTEPASEPVLEPEPEPALDSTDDSPATTAAATELQPRGEAAQDRATEPQPRGEAALDPAPEPEPSAAGEIAALPDFVVEPEDKPAPITVPSSSGVRPSAPVTAESILNPEPPPGPLPDFVIDPERESDTGSPLPSPAVEPETQADEPLLENLGLPPLTEFPSIPPLPAAGHTTNEPKAQSERGDEAGGGRREAAPPPPPRSGRDRSAGDPGDMSESVDWAGLSSRLSAYSLSSDDSPQPPPTTEDDDAAADAAEDEDGA